MRVTVDDIDALINEAQGTKNELNGLAKIPETVDEVISILFDGPAIVGIHPFTEERACECDSVSFEFYDADRKQWRTAYEPECMIRRMDLPGINGSSYNNPSRNRGQRMEEEYPVISEPLITEEFRPYGGSPAHINAANDRRDREYAHLTAQRDALIRERAERLNSQTSSLEDAHSRWGTSRRAMVELSHALRRAGISPRAGSRLVSGRDIVLLRQRYLEGAISHDEFAYQVNWIFQRFLTEVAPRVGEPVSGALDENEVQVVQDAPGRWHVARRGDLRQDRPSHN
jgi:hypothetical protein